MTQIFYKQSVYDTIFFKTFKKYYLISRSRGTGLENFPRNGLSMQSILSIKSVVWLHMSVEDVQNCYQFKKILTC